MLPAILICAFMVQYVATQAVTASLGTTKKCVVEERDDVKLLCTVSDGCCRSARVWEKVAGAVSLLSNGLSTTDPSKYVEDYDGGGMVGGFTEFNLIIKIVQKSDFEISYQCRYGVTWSNELYLNNTLCDCGECAIQDYGWSILGDVIGTVIIFIIVNIKSMCNTSGTIQTTATTVGELKTTLVIGILTFIISAVVNIPIAVPIGYVVCHCVDGTDPVLIVLGFGTSMITGLIALKIAVNKLRQDLQQRDEHVSPTTYEMLGMQDIPNTYGDLSSEQEQRQCESTTEQYEMLGEQNKPNVYEQIKNKQEPEDRECTNLKV